MPYGINKVVDEQGKEITRLLTTTGLAPGGGGPLDTSQPELAPLPARIEAVYADLLARLTPLAAIIDQQGATIQRQAGIITALQNALPGQISDALTAYNTAMVAPLAQQQATTASALSVLQGTVTTNATAATATLATKASAADLQALTTTVASKALASDLTATNNNVAANTTAINLRATTASVTAMQATVTQNTADIATKATTAALATERTRIDGLLNTTVPALQADTATRLLRTGDTATGLIKGPDATAKTAYPTFQQTFGGVNSPRRTIQNITTGTTPMVALTDTTGQGRTILPIGIQFLLTGSLNLLSNVTVKLGTTSGGAEIYTKTYSVLTGLLGKVTTIDQPITANPLPAGTVLYATVVGGGVWTCFFDAVFLPTAS